VNTVHWFDASSSGNANKLPHNTYITSTVAGLHFYQRVSIASYASAGIARAEMSVCPSVRPLHSGIVSKRRELAS